MSRHHFLTHKQHDGVSFDQSVTDLKQQSAECEFVKLRNSLIKDMIIIGVADNQLRVKLLLSDNLSLEIEIIKNRSSKQNQKEARNDTKLTEARNQTTIDALNTPRSRTKHQENRPSLTLNTNQCKYCSSNQ